MHVQAATKFVWRKGRAAPLWLALSCGERCFFSVASVPGAMSVLGVCVWAALACISAVNALVWDATAFGRGRLPRHDDALRPLEWGQLQVLHTTDIHGWYQGHAKLSPPEPNYSGDWGDWIAFTQHMRERAAERGADLLFVDTGDLRTYNAALTSKTTGMVCRMRACRCRIRSAHL